MQTRLRSRPIPHIIIPDTSILWCEDKKPVVNPEFDDFWARHQHLVPLRLKIPAVVRGELLFQQAMSAEKHLEKTSAALNELCAVADFKHELTLKRDEVKAQICQKFEKWMGLKLATVLPLPEQVNWAQIAEAAIWRKPPFVFDSKNLENEKGFRDALILETVCDYAMKETQDVGIAFVCADRLLFDSAKTRLTGISKFACHESLSELSSYLKLVHERHEKEFTTVLLSAATKRFFTPNDQHCIWVQEDIPARIASDHNQALNLSSNEAALWEPLNSGTWFADNPRFDKRDEDGTYHWHSSLTFIRAYKYAQLTLENMQQKSKSSLFQTFTNVLTSLATEIRNLLQVHFVVLWSMRLNRAGQIRSTRIEEITLKSRSFERLDDETRKRFNITSA
jgi:hypothetical protein